MTELERYKKAYIALHGRLDDVIFKLGDCESALSHANHLLLVAVEEAEQIMKTGNSIEDDDLEFEAALAEIKADT